jgi:cellulose synthase/poly-beta-1,6-N-acetylglucosamine synthase-like glycosyltransferase
MMAQTVVHVLVALPFALLLYAYAGYPIALRAAVWIRARRRQPDTPTTSRSDRDWPSVAIVVVCYNEERAIRATVERLLDLDYPSDRFTIVIVSDGSTDGTSEIVRSFASRGVRHIALPVRRGKAAAENSAREFVRADIIVNVDATIRVLPGALKPLIRAFDDPTIGVASGCDLSEGDSVTEGNQAESGYVDYEMWVRSLETRLGSIVGASGCFYAIRGALYENWIAEELCHRDFASVLVARHSGFRSISVADALCVVPRTPAVRAEYRRKARTMALGLQTLWYHRALLNPLRHGAFAIMLFSHKLCRWLVSLFMPFALAALAFASVGSIFALYAIVALAGMMLLGIVGLAWPPGRAVPALFSFPAYVLASNAAGVVAWKRVFGRELRPTWEPTRRVT